VNCLINSAPLLPAKPLPYIESISLLDWSRAA
jgi:hypothetical protein